MSCSIVNFASVKAANSVLYVSTLVKSYSNVAVFATAPFAKSYAAFTAFGVAATFSAVELVALDNLVTP